MNTTLKLAAIYNILWGAWVVLFPNHFWELVGMEPMRHPMVWQGMGMVIGVYGLGYWWASYDPMRHWPIVAVGGLGKLFGPAGFLMNYLTGLVPFGFFFTRVVTGGVRHRCAGANLAGAVGDLPGFPSLSQRRF